ncbi:MAG: AAA family ATPase [Gemmatimonas sp.]
MQRILIIGSSGAGKSTLSRALGVATGIPVIHLDAQFWQPGWQETPREMWTARVAELLETERWIMDGNYGGTLPMRVQAADTVVLIALSKWLCLARVLRRSIGGYGKVRPDLNAGCPEQLPDWKFLRWIWAYEREKLPEILRMLHAEEGRRKVIVLKSRREVSDFLATFEKP